jgi:putative ABC transport system ATP-binding protein
MSSVIKAESVSKVYQDKGVPVQALQGVDLEIEEGDFAAIAGPSGSGKTTFLNLVGTLDTVSGGKILIDNQDIATLSPRELAKIRLYKLGFVFQAYNLIPVLTCKENAEFVLLLQKVPAQERQKRVDDLLSTVGLGEMKHRLPRELSGGQQQRVAIVRAIASHPRVVLADEPTANLDSKTGKALMELMQELNKNYGIAFFFSTHDPMVMEAAKKLITLKDGKIVDIKKR